MFFSSHKTIEKGLKEGVTTTVAAAVVLQLVLEQLLGVEVSKEQLIEVSGALGIVTGVVRAAFNWFKHRKKK